MASFKKTYDTDSIVLRRIFAYDPDTNGRVSTNSMLVTGNGGSASFQDTISFLSTVGVPTSLASMGQIFNSTFLVPGSNISFSLDGNQLTINGQAGEAGSIAVSDLTSTTKGLGTLGYLSSKIGLISTPQLTSSLIGLGTLGYLSSKAGLISTPQLTSTTQGLGLLGYLSSFNTVSSLNISSGSHFTSFLSSQRIMASSITANKFVGDGSLLVNVPGAGGIAASDVTSTTQGLGLLGYLSSFNTVSSLNISSGSHFTSFLSSQRIMASSITANKFVGDGSLLVNVPGAGGIAASDVTSTTQGLGLLGYLSSFNTVSSLNISSGSQYTGFLSSQRIMASSITANKFVGDGSLLVNVPNLGVTYITAGTGIGVDTNTGNVTVTNNGVISITQGSGISITGSDGAYTITATGGTPGTVAAADLVSTTIGINIITISNITSTTKGLGLLGYLSSFNTISSLNISSGSQYTGFLSSQQIMASSITANKFIGDGSLLVNVPGGGGISASDITSTTQGLGLLGYLSSSAELISSPQLTSSLVGLSNLGYILSPDMTSSLVGLSNLGYILSPDMTSSLTGLGTLGYLSSSAELISTPQLTSSLIGLGSMRYISSFDTISSVNISSTSLFTSTTSTTEITAGRVNFGTLYVNNTPIVFDQYGNLQLSFQTL